MKSPFSFDPRADLKNYREALQQMLEGGWVLPRDLMPSPLNVVVVAVDVLDNGPDIVIKAGLPGVKPEDVSVRVQGKMLTIKATISEEDLDTRGATYLRRERRASSFVRTIQLPAAVEAGRAEARCKNGVLTLTLPKSEHTRARDIKVTANK